MKYKLSDICDIKVGFPFKSELFNENGDGIRLVRGMNVSCTGFRWGNQTRWWNYYTKDLEKYLLKEEDVLIAMDGNVSTNFVQVTKDDLPLLLVQRVARLRAKNVPQKIVWYIVKSHEFGAYLDSVKTGTTISHISAKQIGDYEIDLPDYLTQEKISSILSILDDKIRLNNKINNNLEQQAATVFAKWIHGCTDRITIGELSYNILDYTPIENELVRLLNSSDVTEGVFPASPLVPNTDLKGHFKKRFQFGDILYSEIRPRNHHYGFALFDASEYLASTRLMVIRAVEKKVSPAMLYQYLLLPEVEAEFTLKTESRSGTFPQGNYADMASIIVPYSSINTQTEVSKVLSQIRNTMALKQLENQRLSELRDTLLPKLMSGEIDVTDIDI